MKNFYEKYYKALEGATIIEFIGMNEDDFGGKPFPSFKVKLKNNVYLNIEISQDEEGNGGGFIFGLPTPFTK
jgi:hypothetical protein